MSLDFQRYHAYIESDGETRGYLYAPTPEQRQSVPLQPVRQDGPSPNPYERMAEIGDLFAQGDFSLGEGQQFFHRKGADYRKFLHSSGFDINHFRKTGHLTDTHLIHSNIGAEIITASPPTTRFAQVTDGVFWGVGTQVAFTSAIDVAIQEEDPQSGGTDDVLDITSDGINVYVALGPGGVWMRDGTGVWAEFWPDGAGPLTGVGDVTGVEWVRGHLFTIGNGGRSLFDVTSDSSPTAIEDLAEGWEFTSIFTTGQFVYTCAVSEGKGESEVHHYGVNDDPTLYEFQGFVTMPKGELIYVGSGGLQAILIAGGRRIENQMVPVIYRGIPEADGFIQYVKIAEGYLADSGGADYRVHSIASLGSIVVFDWPQGNFAPFGESFGLAAYHIGKDSFSTFYQNVGDDFENPVLAVTMFGGRVLWHQGVSLYHETPGVYSTRATFISSIGDWNSPGTYKDWDRIEIGHNALPTGTSVEVYYTTDHPEENDWTLAGTSETTGSEGAVFPMSVRSRRLTVMLISNSSTVTGTITELALSGVLGESRIGSILLGGDGELEESDDPGSTAPEISGFSVRSLQSTSTEAPDDRREWMFPRKIRLKRELQKKRGSQPVLIAPRDERDWLEDLLLKTVTIYEPDQTWTARVEQVLTEQKGDPPYVHDEQDKEEWEVTLTLRGVKA